MNREEFKASVARTEPPQGLSVPLTALWWDAKGDWPHSHALVDELKTRDGMAVHAYLHRKEGQDTNADYWYARAGREFLRPSFDAEWDALVDSLLSSTVRSGKRGTWKAVAEPLSENKMRTLEQPIRSIGGSRSRLWFANAMLSAVL